MTTDNYYSTSDLALATAISLFYPIEVIDKTIDPHRAHFLFRRDTAPDLDQLIEAYFRNELRVSPLSYFSQLKAIKVRLYEKGAS